MIGKEACQYEGIALERLSTSDSLPDIDTSSSTMTTLPDLATSFGTMDSLPTFDADLHLESLASDAGLELLDDRMRFAADSAELFGLEPAFELENGRAESLALYGFTDMKPQELGRQASALTASDDDAHRLPLRELCIASAACLCDIVEASSDHALVQTPPLTAGERAISGARSFRERGSENGMHSLEYMCPAPPTTAAPVHQFARRHPATTSLHMDVLPGNDGKASKLERQLPVHDTSTEAPGLASAKKFITTLAPKRPCGSGASAIAALRVGLPEATNPTPLIPVAPAAKPQRPRPCHSVARPKTRELCRDTSQHSA